MRHGMVSWAGVCGLAAALLLPGQLHAQEAAQGEAPAPLPQVPEATPPPDELKVPEAPPLTDFPKRAEAREEPAEMPRLTPPA